MNSRTAVCGEFKKSSTDVGFFKPISLVCRDYLPFSLSETVEEPLCVAKDCLKKAGEPNGKKRTICPPDKTAFFLVGEEQVNFFRFFDCFKKKS